MKLGKKIVFGIGLIWLLFFFVIYGSSELFLFSSIQRIERNLANDNLYRVKEALYQEKSSLDSFVNDWGHWDDLYYFIKGTRPEFIKNNMTPNVFYKINIDYIGLWNKQDKFIFEFKSDPHFNINIDPSQPNKGIELFNGQLFLVSTNEITDSYQQQRPDGIIVAGRLIDQHVIDRLENITKIPIEIYSLDQLDKNAELHFFFQHALAEKENMLINIIDKKSLNVYSVLMNTQMRPIGMLKITLPRSISSIGNEAINYYLAGTLFLGVIFSIFMFVFIKKIIIQRLQHLDSTLSLIKKDQNLGLRVDTSGHDELSSVSLTINLMLDMIQSGHIELEKRVDERTKKLKQEVIERKNTERQLNESKEQLAKLAHFDNVTSLPNRVFFNELLNKAIISAKRHHELLAVLFLDIDHFKKINDAFGHKMGDIVLNHVGKRFKAILRSEDTIARSGGDEFIILLNNIQETKYAGFVAEKIIKACEKPIQIDELEFFIDISMGISIFPNDGDSLEDLEKNADMAMYKAKKEGGCVYRYYTHEMELAAHEYIKMEALLRKALAQNEFELYFQPQLTLADGSIKHAESLIRWNNPEMGLVGPDHFIPLAEKIGFIIPIGEWAIHEVCRMNKAWQDAGYDPITVAVNISAKQLHHQDVVKIITEALTKTQLDPRYLDVEVTESAIMENIELAIMKLKAIHDIGVNISIDDFGTGYTSISYLRQFPVNILKIDQTFIKGIPDQQNDIAITSAVIALAHNLGLKVIAEGVETVEQIQFLINHQCDMIQGYYLSRPVPAGEMVEFFRIKGRPAK